MSHQPISVEEMEIANARMHLMSKDELIAYQARLMASLPPEAQEVFRRNESEAKARPSRIELTSITADILRELSGEDLDQAISQYVETRLEDAEDKPGALMQR